MACNDEIMAETKREPNTPSGF